MTPEQVKELRKLSKDELIRIVIDLDQKLFHLIKDNFKANDDRREKDLNEFMN